MATATATQLLRSFNLPPPLWPSNSPSPASILHRSPPTPHTHALRHLHVPPREGQLPKIRWFRTGSRQYTSSSSKTAQPRRRILGNMLSASSVCTFAAAAFNNMNDELYNDNNDDDYKYDYDDNQEPPPSHGSIDREKRKWTDVLIALNLLVHVVDIVTSRKLLMWGVKNNDLIRKGQLWRLATSSLLHSGMIHITCNMFALDDIGSTMEEVTGPGRFLAIYCTSALAGQLMSYSFTNGNSVGASGAISGLFGAQAVYTWKHRESLENSGETLNEIKLLILLNLGIGLVLRLFKIRIDNWAHLGGLLGGAAVEWFLGPDSKQHAANDVTAGFEDKEAPIL